VEAVQQFRAATLITDQAFERVALLEGEVVIVHKDSLASDVPEHDATLTLPRFAGLIYVKRIS
jgi:hypothetical protein